MAHHKRHRPKNRRAGCLMCKPWKMNGYGKRKRLDGEPFSEAKQRQVASEAIRER